MFISCARILVAALALIGLTAPSASADGSSSPASGNGNTGAVSWHVGCCP